MAEEGHTAAPTEEQASFETTSVTVDRDLAAKIEEAKEATPVSSAEATSMPAVVRKFDRLWATNCI